MELLNMRQQAQRVIRFVTVQFIALVGWIVVQSTFSLSPLGHNIPFALMMVIEAVWWIALLAIMFLLFKVELNRFVQSALELEEANRRLRETTNNILTHLGNQSDQEESAYRLD